MKNTNRKPLYLLILAFAAIYVIWGSTYLGIKYAVEDIPPFLMAGTRFGIAGLLMFIAGMFMGIPKPKWTHWKNAAFFGAFFIMVSNGGVTWAEQYVDSGIASLIITSEPLLIVLLLWALQGQKPNLAGILGVILGIVGMALLIGPQTFSNSDSNLLGLAICGLAAFSWSFGSIYTKNAKLPPFQLQSAAMQMLCGGTMLLIISAFSGELNGFTLAAVHTEAWVAWVYLTIFGSIVAFSAFSWLLKVENPNKVATFAYVNPVIALFLGWFFRDEILNTQSLIAAAMMILGVVFINFSKTKEREKVSA